MIITTRRHGRDRRATTNLLAHLAKTRQQSVEIAMVSNSVATTPAAALRLMERARDAHARAEVAFHHMTLSPTRELSEPELHEAVARVLDRLGAHEHAYVVWRHEKSGEPAHFHIVVGHVGPTGRCIDDRQSFARLEAAARSLEVQFGERLTHSRRASQVAALLDETEPEIAAAIRAAAPDEPPRSAMRSSTRAVAERVGFDLPAAKTKIRALWQQSDGPRAALAALADAGFLIELGEKAGVFIVKSGDFTVGALDRLAGSKRAEIAAAMSQARVEEQKNERDRNILIVADPVNDREGWRPRDRSEKRNRRDALDRADDLGAAPAASRRIPTFANDGVDFDRAGIAFSEGGPGREEDRSAFAALTPFDLAKIALADRDPHARELAARAARLAQPAQELTPADRAEIGRADRDPRAHELAARVARLAQPSPGPASADLVAIMKADRDPRARELVARAARLSRLFQLDRRETRAADVLTQSFEPPSAPAALGPALVKAKRAEQAAALARASKQEAERALEQHLACRRPHWFGWLTGARQRYDAELRSKQDVAVRCVSERQRAEVAAAIASAASQKLVRQHERVCIAARDADARRRGQARAQLRWCADARIALRDFPDLAAKNIRDAIEEVHRRRERNEEEYYNSVSPRRMTPR